MTTHNPVKEDTLVAVLAAAFARSNFGHGVDREKLERMLDADRPVTRSRAAICDYVGHLIENDEMEEMFSAEAEGWARDINAMGLNHFIKTYETHNKWLSVFKERMA